MRIASLVASMLLLAPMVTLAADPPGVKIDRDRLARLKAAKMPAIDKPVSYETPEADAICAALEVFPPENPWNLVIDEWPVHPRSAAIIATIGPGKPLRYNDDMAFVFVPPNQPRVPLVEIEYKGESEPGPFPIPANVPIEGWPANYQRNPAWAKLTLEQVQRDTAKIGGDRHIIVVDPINRKLYEAWARYKTDAGWKVGSAAEFDLSTNKLRPAGWTSADAAGLPIFPAIVRHDELQRGKIEHALRFTVRRTKREYVYPATHFASRLTDADLPRMGERFRLRKDFDTSGFSPQVRTILEALKRHGMFVADNGLDWAMSVSADPRVPVLHEELRKVKGSDFEVVTPPPGYTPAR